MRAVIEKSCLPADCAIYLDDKMSFARRKNLFGILTTYMQMDTFNEPFFISSPCVSDTKNNPILPNK